MTTVAVSGAAGMISNHLLFKVSIPASPECFRFLNVTTEDFVIYALFALPIEFATYLPENSYIGN